PALRVRRTRGTFPLPLARRAFVGRVAMGGLAVRRTAASRRRADATAVERVEAGLNKVFANPWTILLYIAPALVLVLGLIYVPIVFTGYYGLMKWDGIGEMRFIGLDNYRHLLKDGVFWHSAKNSVLLAVFSTAALGGHLVTALVLTEKIKGADFFRKVYVLPLLLSTVAIAQLWARVYH